MTSSNGHFLLHYWPFVRGIHRHWWISTLKASDVELRSSFDVRLNKRLIKHSWSSWFETPLRLYNVNVTKGIFCVAAMCSSTPDIYSNLVLMLWHSLWSVTFHQLCLIKNIAFGSRNAMFFSLKQLSELLWPISTKKMAIYSVDYI